MGSGPPTIEPHVERPGPAEFRDPMVVRELKRARPGLVIGNFSRAKRERGGPPRRAAIEGRTR